MRRVTTLFFFMARHAAILAVLLLTAAGAGTLAVGSRFSLAFRSALGLALWGQALFLLGIIGQLRVVPIAALTFVAIAGGALRGRLIPRTRPGASILGIVCGATFVAVFLLALHPPLAFDETLYHLPFVRALAVSGKLRFLADVRFPVFPQLHELLCVPLFLLAGDVATHLVSLAEVLITTGLLLEWGRRYETRAGSLAAAVFLGSPIVLHLATVGYADAALTLFVTAGFYCLDRARLEQRGWFAFSGLFFGTACSVKYLGGYFAAAALVLVALFSFERRRAAATFAASCLAAALPTTLWLIVTTGNPLFPFLGEIFGSTAWSISLEPVAVETRVVRTLRLMWDVTFARERVNFQPPFTPMLGAAVAMVLAAAFRDVGARCVALVTAGYLVVFSFLPQDSRYLVPLLPLLSIAAAAAVTKRWPTAAGWLALIAIAPGLAYAAYRLAVNGMPPSTAPERNEMLAKRIPEYGALIRAEEGRIYVCGAEQLKYYARGELLGDVTGLYSYERVLAGAGSTATIAKHLKRIDAQYFLVAKRVCAPPRRNGGMDLVFEDAAAQLWRVRDHPPSS
jgi:hypothetical protein